MIAPPGDPLQKATAKSKYRRARSAVRYGRGILGDSQLRRADLAVLERRACPGSRGMPSSCRLGNGWVVQVLLEPDDEPGAGIATRCHGRIGARYGQVR
jgi:hypothetical protein